MIDDDRIKTRNENLSNSTSILTFKNNLEINMSESRLKTSFSLRKDKLQKTFMNNRLTSLSLEKEGLDFQIEPTKLKNINEFIIDKIL